MDLAGKGNGVRGYGLGFLLTHLPSFCLVFYLLSSFLRVIYVHYQHSTPISPLILCLSISKVRFGSVLHIRLQVG